MVTSNGGDFDDDPAVTEGESVAEADEELDVGPRRWSWTDFGVTSLCLARNLFGNVAGFFDAVGGQLQCHEAYRRSHIDFASDVMKDIGRL
jgi:hypothetical protein